MRAWQAFNKFMNRHKQIVKHIKNTHYPDYEIMDISSIKSIIHFFALNIFFSALVYFQIVSFARKLIEVVYHAIQ